MNQALQDNCENEIDFKPAKTVNTSVYSLNNHSSDDLITSRSILKPSNNINLQSSKKVKNDVNLSYITLLYNRLIIGFWNGDRFEVCSSYDADLLCYHKELKYVVVYFLYNNKWL